MFQSVNLSRFGWYKWICALIRNYSLLNIQIVFEVVGVGVRADTNDASLVRAIQIVDIGSLQRFAALVVVAYALDCV
jgi:hypothetical protein